MTVAADVRAGATSTELNAAASETRQEDLARHALDGRRALQRLDADLTSFLNTDLALSAALAVSALQALAVDLAGRYEGVASREGGVPQLDDDTFDATRALREAVLAVEDAYDTDFEDPDHYAMELEPTVDALADSLLAAAEAADAQKRATITRRALHRAHRQSLLMVDEGRPVGHWIRLAGAVVVSMTANDARRERRDVRMQEQQDLRARSWAAHALREVAS